MEPILGLVVGGAGRTVEYLVGHDDVAPHWEAVADHGFVGERHLFLVDDEVLVGVADGLLGLPVAEVGESAPALRVDRVRSDHCAVEIVGLREEKLETTCTGVEMFNKTLDYGEAGDNVGVLLRGVKKNEVERGMVLAKPKSITPHTKFEAEVYILSKDEGGRHTPFFKGYRPQFYFRTTDVTGAVELPEGVEMVMPGDNVQMKVDLIAPIAMEEGLRFAIREGGRTVGAGVVAKIFE